MNLISQYAMSFLSTPTPYVWAGNNRLGMDCSGYICEILKAFNYIRGNQDLSAQSIHDLLAAQKLKSNIGESSILLFGTDNRNINHVAMALNDRVMIEAGGAGSDCRTPEQAHKLNAYVRIRPILSRRNLVACFRLPWED